MIINELSRSVDLPYRDEIAQAWLKDEKECVLMLIQDARIEPSQQYNIEFLAGSLVSNVRKERLNKSGLDAFMIQYDLSSEEGIVLMCLAEALLRIPDAYTADKLIKDKLTSANWEEHLGKSESLFVNAATWGLMLTGKLIDNKNQKSKYFGNILQNFLTERSKPVIRRAVLQGMKILGQQYVMGETIQTACKRAKKLEKKGYCYSYDMLGEAALTMKDADSYFQEYSNAIDAIGKDASGDTVKNNPGISVKLSALHPRYELAQAERIHKEMYPRLLKLMEQAKKYNIGLNIDAEETERLEISLELIERLAHESSLENWQGIGIVVQAYQKRAPIVLDYLIDLAKRTYNRFMIRLVKGAYWDAEIKHAQEQGLDGYPVFTRKCYTDVSYHACVKKVFANTDFIYPQFATHNALAVATIVEFAGDYRDFEFQCLHGMGDALYDHVVGEQNLNIPCRIYAPVGTYDHLLPYLVRRLLENGANSSFVNRIVDEKVPIEQLTDDPVNLAAMFNYEPNNQIVLPRNIYGEKRMNSQGINIYDKQTLITIADEMSKSLSNVLLAYPLIAGKDEFDGEKEKILNPANQDEVVGFVINAEDHDVELALKNAQSAFEKWDATSADIRGEMLTNMADLLEENMAKFLAIAIKEAGKTIPNAISELREAIDFCRYYAAQVQAEFTEPKILPGPTGELNEISLHGRGVVVCISPWNFPLAIFLGQLTAALAAGNTVIAKPAEQTPLIAFEAIKLLYQAGVPKDVLQFLPGDGETVGAKLINDSRTAGVIFTGSTEVAHVIQKTLANKPGAIVPFIAETGGQNVMVVDSSALAEQVVKDILISAFDSAGQRCSALRVLYLQEEIADTVLDMLKGAMAELKIGDPQWLENDIGPVIDKEAQAHLAKHIESMRKSGKFVYQTPLEDKLKQGTFIAPTIFEIENLSHLKREVFGPILHVVRFKAHKLVDVVDTINGIGYGLTFGIHSRIDKTVEYFKQRIKVGNIYVNRNIVGAVVGAQPFGGQGLSGTGPKAGGPLYLHKLAVERTVSTDTTASGGNASLMTLSETKV